MKLLSVLFFCLFSIKSCGTINQTETNENIISFEYVASSRGAYTKIKVIKNLIIVSTKRGKPGPSKKLDNSDWNKLLQLLQTIQLETIPELEAPSKNFMFDGGAKTTLKITSNGKIYETPPFDHGNPPKEVDALIKELLSISEIVE